MKLITLCGLTAAFFSAFVQADSASEMHKKTKAFIIPFNDPDCHMNGQRDRKEIKQEHCENVDHFDSYHIELKGRKHDDIHKKDCEVYVYESKYCHGRSQPYQWLYSSAGRCKDVSFVTHDGGRMGGMSVKFSCKGKSKDPKHSKQPKGSKSSSAVPTASLITVVVPSSSEPVETVTMIQPSASVEKECTTGCITKTTTPSAYPVPPPAAVGSAMA